METLESILSIDTNYFLVGLIVVFYALEQLLTDQFKFEKRAKHFYHNLMLLIAFMLGNILWAVVTVNSIQWLNDNRIGLLYLFDMPLWVKVFLGVLLFDLVTYWFHRLGHIVPVLWRFHRVHHSDNTMDASTPLRGHPFELYFWFGTGNILTAAIFGLDLFALGIYFLILTPFLVLEHSNLKFPTWLDKTVGLVFTTPNLHKIHHDRDQHYTDSNFSDIFILWDRIFGTYTYKHPSEVRFGLKEFDGEDQQTWWYMLKNPFLKVERKTSDDQ